MTTTDFIPKPYKVEPTSKIYSQTSPSNIALVKYWGKKQGQIPANASLSFSLTEATTSTWLKILPKKNDKKFDFDFYFHSQRNEKFLPKIETFFSRIEKYMPFLSEVHLEIHSENSFPHSSGIASSASSMAALSLCLMQVEADFSSFTLADFHDKKASFLARLGSGSASRSTLKGVAIWGNHSQVSQSSDLYAVPMPTPLHPIFQKYQDTILLIDEGQKKISSTTGHQLMNGHPFAEQRFVQAQKNLTDLMQTLQTGDLEKFIQITESEALTLHAMMMCSQPYFILMKPKTLSVIEKIWDFREQTSLPLGFTLDAGANLHLLYPEQYKEKIRPFIDQELKNFCQNERLIYDSLL